MTTKSKKPQQSGGKAGISEKTDQQSKKPVAQAQQKVDEVVAQTKETAGELAAQAKAAASDAVAQAKQEAKSTFDDQKTRATGHLDSVASALRKSSRGFEDEDYGPIAEYADMVADQVDRFSGYLREHNAGDLLNDIQRFAHRQPELFTVGALAAGFLLGRFLKSSQRDTQATYTSSSSRESS